MTDYWYYGPNDWDTDGKRVFGEGYAFHTMTSDYWAAADLYFKSLPYFLPDDMTEDDEDETVTSTSD